MFLHVLKVELGSPSCGKSGHHVNKVGTFGDRVYYNHDGVVAG